MGNLAPIILFTYNRLEHTKKVVESLAKNSLAKDSKLIIFCDNYKDNATFDEQQKVARVREYVKQISHIFKGIFKAGVELNFRDKNLGLADSIISGVTEVVNQYDKAIILEDDIVVSPVFLDYMNAGLVKYKDEPKVYSISAWNYPIDTSNLDDCFFWRIPHCWGWAIWSDRWKLFKRDIDWVLENFDKNDIKYINLDGYASFYSHFLLNVNGKIKTWAIFSYLISYKYRTLTLMPKLSYVKQIGFDGSGVHCGSEDIYNPPSINEKFPINFPKYIEESSIALSRIQNFHLSLKTPLKIKIKNKIIRLFKKCIGSKAKI
ncbi:sugar transferase [Helicobacter sp. MIT 14-3879]|uniref:sugar transferase n=1 Tax=Helicobacter sp. MIT 14-3879 TaxID=2040649 RepID=UPI000E1E4736|nr:sugar transferase [Helicobacter sp. MIT 14-3879]RDU64849.1 sugar transferase [Helicobacter sp. MIT 14-3879]